MICFMNVFEHAQLWPTRRKKNFHTPLPKKVVKTTNSHLEPLPNMEMLELPPEHGIHGGIATKPFKTIQVHHQTLRPGK